MKEKNDGKPFVAVLQKFRLYDLEKLTLLSRNHQGSDLRVIPKDVAKLIAQFTILPPHEALQPNDNIVDAPVEVQVNFR